MYKRLWTTTVLITIVAVATILAFAGHLIAGRLVGLSITAFCSATMAFFLMPPLYSLRVSQTHDIIALAFYGTAGLVLAKTAPPERKRAVVRVAPICDRGPRERVETDLSRAVADLMSSELGGRLSAVDFAITGESFALPCTHDETLRILTDVLTAALQTPKVQRVSIYGGQRPSARLLTVAAHCVWPPPQGKVIIIGKRAEDCELATFPDWPSYSSASWFDNGCDRVYQISVQDRRMNYAGMIALRLSRVV
jgi:hypothetical protein